MIPQLSLRVSQHLALTPQLQQSIRLLQLSTLEMAAEVEQMLDDNPFLERDTDNDSDTDTAERDAFGLGPAEPAGAADTAAQDGSDSALYSGAASASPASSEGPNDPETAPAADLPDWDGDGSSDLAPDDGEWGGEAPARNTGPGSDADADGAADATELARSHGTLQQFLHHQALSLRLSENDRAALYFLIESLSDDGYLEEPLQALAAALQPDTGSEDFAQLLHHLTVALHLLHSLEPTGVGARSLAECLQLQLRALQQELQQQQYRPAPPAHLVGTASSTAGADPEDRHAGPGSAGARSTGKADPADPASTVAVALAICQQPMELLARRDLRRLGQACQATPAQVRAAMGLVARLEPRPGRRFADVERNAIVPDVLVRPTRRGAQDFVVQLNPDVVPRLRVHDLYAGALRGHRGSDGHQALQQRLQEARWFIKNIQQRFDTILRVSTAIVERQKNFFLHGALAMRPLVLRDIAEELGLHESTISRVTTAKYMATPQGTFELKYFFGSGLGTDTGGNASSTAVRALLQQFIAAENPAKPLSDSQLADMLKEQGIECARRTVAKYREGLKIPVASLRRAL